MTHINGYLSLNKPSLLRILTVGAAAVCMLACGATDPDNTEHASSTSEALTGYRALIQYTDTRTATSFDIGIETADQNHPNGPFYGGNAFVPGPVTSGTSGYDYMVWNQDGLFQNSGGYTTNASLIQITDTTSGTQVFTTMRLTVLATINGACHYDYEDIDLSQDVNLEFNGWGGTYNSSAGCWEGDLLRHQ